MIGLGKSHLDVILVGELWEGIWSLLIIEVEKDGVSLVIGQVHWVVKKIVEAIEGLIIGRGLTTSEKNVYVQVIMVVVLFVVIPQVWIGEGFEVDGLVSREVKRILSWPSSVLLFHASISDLGEEPNIELGSIKDREPVFRVT